MPTMAECTCGRTKSDAEHAPDCAVKIAAAPPSVPGWERHTHADEKKVALLLAPGVTATARVLRERFDVLPDYSSAELRMAAQLRPGHYDIPLELPRPRRWQTILAMVAVLRGARA